MRTRLAGMHLHGDGAKLSVIPLKTVRDPEFESGGGGLYASDYLKFMCMILNAGRGNGNQVLKPGYGDPDVAQCRGRASRGQAAHADSLSRAQVEIFLGMPKTWGLGFTINESAAPNSRSAGSLACAGLAYFWVDPTLNIAGLAMMQALPFGGTENRGRVLRFRKGRLRLAELMPCRRITTST